MRIISEKEVKVLLIMFFFFKTKIRSKVLYTYLSCRPMMIAIMCEPSWYLVCLNLGRASCYGRLTFGFLFSSHLNQLLMTNPLERLDPIMHLLLRLPFFSPFFFFGFFHFLLTSSFSFHMDLCSWVAFGKGLLSCLGSL